MLVVGRYRYEDDNDTQITGAAGKGGFTGKELKVNGDKGGARVWSRTCRTYWWVDLI